MRDHSDQKIGQEMGSAQVTSSKVVWVTGASRGIGAATACYLAAKGMCVVLTARSEEDVRDVAARITKAGGQAIYKACDVTDYQALKDVVTDATEVFGGVDVLVNNAGTIDPVAKIDAIDPADWARVIDVNIKGVFNATHAVLGHMLENGGGTIVNISSGAATRVLEGWSHYCASKAAVLQLTKSLHLEYKDQGLRVFGLSPGTVATDMQRVIKSSGLNPVSQLEWSDHIPPEWPAQAIHYLCDPEADDLRGDDFSIKTPEGRERVGLLPPREMV